MRLVFWRKLAVVSWLCCWPCYLPPWRTVQLQISPDPIRVTLILTQLPEWGHCGELATSETSKKAVVLWPSTS